MPRPALTNGTLALLLLSACSSDCPASDAAPVSAGGEAPVIVGARQNRSPTASPDEETRALGAAIAETPGPNALVAALGEIHYAYPPVEAARATCLAAASAMVAQDESRRLLARYCVRLLAVIGIGPQPEPFDQTFAADLSDSDPRVPDDDSPYDEYTIEAGDGWTIAADMQSTDFDTYLWLIGPDGALLAMDDDSGEETNSRFVFTTREPGTYTVRANSYDGAGRGEYTLHVTVAP